MSLDELGETLDSYSVLQAPKDHAVAFMSA